MQPQCHSPSLATLSLAMDTTPLCRQCELGSTVIVDNESTMSGIEDMHVQVSCSVPTQPRDMPPPLSHHKSPYARVPLPSQLDDDVLPHPFLTFTRAPVVHYDVRDPPPDPSSFGEYGHVFNEPATRPPLPSLTLLIQNFPWSIIAHASVSRRGQGIVTVPDVLNALYDNLHLPAAEDVVYGGSLFLKPNLEVKRIGAHSKRQAVQRLEYLGGRVIFKGLSPSSMGPETMVAHLGRI